jgi:hypothetical protein
MFGREVNRERRKGDFFLGGVGGLRICRYVRTSLRIGGMLCMGLWNICKLQYLDYDFGIVIIRFWLVAGPC